MTIRARYLTRQTDTLCDLDVVLRANGAGSRKYLHERLGDKRFQQCGSDAHPPGEAAYQCQ
jgi:hypothetical protein